MATPLQQLQSIEITDFIGHVIDHQTQRLELSGARTPLGPHSAFPSALFQDYILDTLKDDKRRHGLWGAPAGVVAGAFAALRAGGDFVAGSQAIATHLYAVMSGSQYAGKIKPGDIMVVRFREAEDAGPAPYLAVLKIDPSLAFIRRLEEVGGVLQMVFEQEAVIPRPAKGQVHKVALLAPERQVEPEPHDLVVLDNDLPRREVAQFFYRGFLEAALVRSAADGTRLLLDGLRAVVSAPDLGLDAIERNAVFTAGCAALAAAGLVTPRGLAQQAVAGLPAAAQAPVAARLMTFYATTLPVEDQIQPDDPVPIAPQQAESATRTLTYRLDDGVTIRGREEALARMLEFSRPDAEGKTTLRLRTSRVSWS
jgi:hypothetical protein